MVDVGRPLLDPEPPEVAPEEIPVVGNIVAVGLRDGERCLPDIGSKVGILLVQVVCERLRRFHQLLADGMGHIPYLVRVDLARTIFSPQQILSQLGEVLGDLLGGDGAVPANREVLCQFGNITLPHGQGLRRGPLGLPLPVGSLGGAPLGGLGDALELLQARLQLLVFPPQALDALQLPGELGPFHAVGLFQPGIVISSRILHHFHADTLQPAAQFVAAGIRDDGGQDLVEADGPLRLGLEDIDRHLGDVKKQVPQLRSEGSTDLISAPGKLFDDAVDGDFVSTGRIHEHFTDGIHVHELVAVLAVGLGVVDPFHEGKKTIVQLVVNGLGLLLGQVLQPSLQLVHILDAGEPRRRTCPERLHAIKAGYIPVVAFALRDHCLCDVLQGNGDMGGLKAPQVAGRGIAVFAVIDAAGLLNAPEKVVEPFMVGILVHRISDGLLGSRKILTGRPRFRARDKIFPSIGKYMAQLFCIHDGLDLFLRKAMLFQERAICTLQRVPVVRSPLLPPQHRRSGAGCSTTHKVLSQGGDQMLT